MPGISFLPPAVPWKGGRGTLTTIRIVILLLAMGYFIRPDSTPPALAGGVGAEPDRKMLLHGDPATRRAALGRLVAAGEEGVLTGCLASEDPTVCQLAAAGLWEIWMNEAGPEARHRLDEGLEAMARHEFEAAATLFAELSREFPDWAEALNKEATVRYLQGELAESIALCRKVVAKKPDHFGAWNGMALCAVSLEDWGLAQEAVRESLRLQPGSVHSRQLLKLIESRLQTI